MNVIYLERRDPAKNMNRFYKVIVTQTLFGDWAFVREWGRIGSPGTIWETWYDSEQDALGAGEKLLKQKTRRGYQRR